MINNSLFVTHLRSGVDGGERVGREVGNASTGRLHLRQVGCSCAHHSHRTGPALSRFVQ